MRKRCVSAEEERCLVVKEQTKWFFPLVHLVTSFRGLEEMNGCALCSYTLCSHGIICLFVFFFNRSVIVGPQLSM